MIENDEETFLLTFTVVATHPQLIECSDGTYQIYEIERSWETHRRRWKLLPIRWNRTMWKQFSRYVRRRRRTVAGVSSYDLAWMSIPQLELAKILMAESLDISDTSLVDRLLAYKKEEMFP